MEFHKGTVGTAKFYLPTNDTSVTGVTYSLNGATPSAVSFTTANGVASANLPYFDKEGRLEVTWTFSIPGSGSHTSKDIHEVVTPILTVREVQEIWDESSPQEAFDLEANIRYIIAAHTGQTFGLRNETRTVYGADGNTINMPSRLLSLGTFNGATLNPTAYRIMGDGWYLRATVFGGIPTIRSDYYGVHMDNNGFISNPNHINLRVFAQNARFDIAGDWGWEAVPQSVKEAAKLLVNDYACGDSLYRDRFLQSMTAADWRIQFNDGAFSSTGNVRANQLLADYRLRRGWVVI
jgi:hypothetical protein